MHRWMLAPMKILARHDTTIAPLANSILNAYSPPKNWDDAAWLAVQPMTSRFDLAGPSFSPPRLDPDAFLEQVILITRSESFANDLWLGAVAANLLNAMSHHQQFNTPGLNLAYAIYHHLLWIDDQMQLATKERIARNRTATSSDDATPYHRALQAESPAPPPRHRLVATAAQRPKPTAASGRSLN